MIWSKLKFLGFKAHYQESEKTIHRMGETFWHHMYDKNLISKMCKLSKSIETGK